MGAIVVMFNIGFWWMHILCMCVYRCANNNLLDHSSLLYHIYSGPYPYFQCTSNFFKKQRGKSKYKTLKSFLVTFPAIVEKIDQELSSLTKESTKSVKISACSNCTCVRGGNEIKWVSHTFWEKRKLAVTRQLFYKKKYSAKQDEKGVALCN